MLVAGHQSGAGLTPATIGTERALLLDQLLSAVLPAPYRFGTGDAIDQDGKRSGQLDIVVESPFALSLPIGAAASPRLYLAEAIAAVVEVKSDISKQWNEAVRTARNLEPLRRQLRGHAYVGPAPTERIPFFIVAYQGWTEAAKLREHLSGQPIDGILVIEPGAFASNEQFGSLEAAGGASLWGLICCLHQATNGLKQNTPEPFRYVT
ncbi:MAG: hypothetical protein IH827_02725 [Myxococcales bacterium]|nr:hypothetical protein [Myxococcales bacterium]